MSDSIWYSDEISFYGWMRVCEGVCVGVGVGVGVGVCGCVWKNERKFNFQTFKSQKFSLWLASFQHKDVL